MRITVAWVALLIACGGGQGGLGGSGNPPDKLFVELDSSEIENLCEYIASLIDPRTVSCPTGGEQVVAPLDVAECIADLTGDQVTFSTCMVTAGQTEDCLEDIALRTDAEVCNDEQIPASCIPLFQCS
jgi:hypothetical protein